MTLSPLTRHPARRSYVLKLDRAATPDRDGLTGRLENMASGHHFDFGTADQLIACLIEDLNPLDPEDIR
jgi:hypothetical protein